MTIVANTFRQQFPEFADPLLYSNELIDLWVGIAGRFINPVRWGNTADYGTSLYVAHKLAMSARDQMTARAGGVPGAPQGVLTSKGVRGITASYAVADMMMKDAGEMNSTRYGIEFTRLSRMMGAGGMQMTGLV
jgi:hypothetical protein